MRSLFILLLLGMSPALAQSDAEISEAWRICQSHRVSMRTNPTMPEFSADFNESCTAIKEAYGKTSQARAERAQQEKLAADKAKAEAVAKSLKK